MSKCYIGNFEVRLVREGSLVTDRRIIRSPHDAYLIFNEYFFDKPNEHFVCLLLNTKNHVIGISTVSTGILNASIVHPRELFQRAILANAASVILGHNHPSSDPTPSSEDITLTKSLSSAGTILNIPVLDHIVVGDGNYRSLKEDGLL